eukprot:UN4256
MPFRKPTAVAEREYGDRAAGFAACGGPFVMIPDETLVYDMLTRLGYTGGVDPLHLEMVAVFFDVNKKKLRAHGVERRTTLAENEERLHGVFSSSSIEQHWRCANRDVGVREYLEVMGFLDTMTAPNAEAFRAMGEFLEQHGQSKLPSTYVMRVTLVRRHIDKHDPARRK